MTNEILLKHGRFHVTANGDYSEFASDDLAMAKDKARELALIEGPGAAVWVFDMTSTIRYDRPVFLSTPFGVEKECNFGGLIPVQDDRGNVSWRKPSLKDLQESCDFGVSE